MESAVVSVQLSGKNGWRRTWCKGAYRLPGAKRHILHPCTHSKFRPAPVHRNFKGGKKNHISFRNFHYEADVGPSEHTSYACPCKS